MALDQSGEIRQPMNLLVEMVLDDRPDLDGYTPDEAYESGARKMLAYLGLEQVGMRNPRSGSVHAVLTCGRTHAHRDCEPVYRLAGLSSRTEKDFAATGEHSRDD